MISILTERDIEKGELMKTSMLLITLLFCATVYCEEKKIEYAVKQTTGIIKIDGILDEEDWKNTPVITGFERVLGAGEVNEQSYVKILYGKEDLYIGIEFKEPLISALKEKGGGRIWGDDRIEIPLAVNPELNEYYLFAVNCEGRKEEGYYGSNEYDNPIEDWNPPWEAKTMKGKDSWYIEIKIPYSTLKAIPRKGDIWMINFCRQRNPGAILPVYSAWDKKFNGFHYAGGKLLFE